MFLFKAPLRFFYYIVGKIYRHDERISRSLFNCFPTYSSAFGEVMNQVLRKCQSTRAYALQGIVVEPTNACNLVCRHCTARCKIDEIGFMDIALFRKLIDDNPQLKSIILTRNGEPFLHPLLFEMVRYARSMDVYVILYTNGILLDDLAIERIFSSGLSELNFSMEGVGRFYEQNRGVAYEKLVSVMNRVLHVRNNTGSEMKIGINAVVSDRVESLTDVHREWGGRVDYIAVEPLMGARSNQRCSSCKTLWRNVVITWSGDAVVCCSDMYDTLKLGSIKHNSLIEIFNGQEVRRLRSLHLKKDFPAVCKHCHPHFG